MSIQGSINQSINAVRGAMAVREDVLEQRSPIAKLAKTEEYRRVVANQQVQAKQANITAQKKDIESYVKQYTTNIGKLKDLAPSVQKAIVSADTDLQSRLTKYKELTENGK